MTQEKPISFRCQKKRKIQAAVQYITFFSYYSGTSTSGGSSSAGQRRGTKATTNYLHHSNSEGATSPNESDNTYAEATLLQPNNPRPIRYGQ